ncbi:MAG: bifunctional hydroxymethylpyrimidine kinase/phosphomethylpyrimidine kinase [Thermodesulfobacteriota bacterium]|nr:bifunctional hydroxymethylpyrimidine kinase/phosphomethylpyrimidine kinase [Thermodesulfobacteriota bacterium]
MPMEINHKCLEKVGTVLSIAGSDPSGGAGIQADLKTFVSIGVYGAAAITCLTAQNTLGVSTYLPVDPSFVRKQVELVLQDLNVTHIKIGMTGTEEIIKVIGDLLTGFDGEVVCDPVITASDGHALLEQESVICLCDHIINRTTVLTPNLAELRMITGGSCADSDEAVQAGISLFDEFKSLRAVVIKGGHLEEKRETVTDYLLVMDDKSEKIISKTAVHKRVRTKNTHGTGCTFASAFAAFHMLKGGYEQAFFNAVNFVDSLLNKSASLKFGEGCGPLAHGHITSS